MFNVAALMCYTAVVFICCYAFSYKHIIFTPQFGFAFGFFLQTAYAILWADRWRLDLHPLTGAVYAGGILLFCVVSVLIQAAVCNCRFYFGDPSAMFHGKRVQKAVKQKEYEKIKIDNWKLILFLGFQFLILLLCVRFLLKFAGTRDLSEAIYQYRYLSEFSEESVKVPSYINLSRVACIAAGSFWGYYWVKKIIHKDYTNIVLLSANIFLSILVSVVFGSRGDAFQMLMSIGIMFYFVFEKERGFKGKIRLKQIILFVVGVAAAIFSFQAIGNLLGRNNTRDFSEYISVYLSAELKNFDTFVRRGNFGAPLSRCQTMIYAVNYIAARLRMPALVHKLDVPFMTVGKYSLGNVSTTFYAFMYDGGVWGVIGFTTLMALLGQLMYLLVVKLKNEPYTNIPLIIYSYVYYTFVFSFFSNKFYETVFNIKFVRFVIIWYILKFFVERIKVTIK